jgi:glycosyltransferase involved in cell wall biosynthesis
MKSNGLAVHLQSKVDNGYAQENTHLVYDDYCGKRYIVNRKLNPDNPCWKGLPEDLEEFEMPSAQEVVEQFKPLFKDLKLVFHKTTPRQGISKAKNVGLLYAVENNFDRVMLWDDDIELIKPGLYEELEEISEKNRGLPHITGVWTEDKAFEKQQTQGGTWTDNFPVEAEGYGITWHGGSHGCASWFKVDLIKEVGYYPLMSDLYGFEHSLMTARCMKYIGLTPRWHPQHKTSYRYYIGQKQPIPNNYFDTGESIKKNDIDYNRLFPLIWQGREVINKNHGINWKEYND